MSGHCLDAAWACIRQAMDTDWSSVTSLPLAWDNARLEVQRGGAWRCDAPVSRPVLELLDCLLPLAAHAPPLVIAQLGQSLDGRIATATGASHYVNGIESRVHLHRLRALADAVLVGATTVEADDPQLTVRHVAGRNPVRVVLDPCGRVPADRQMFQSGDAPTLHLVGARAAERHPAGAHVERIVMPLDDDGIAPRAILEILAARGLGRVLIEGGGVTVSRFLEAGVLHRLHLLVSPLLIGSGRPGLSLPPIDTLEQALRPTARSFACGEDTLFDLVFAGPVSPPE